MHIAFLYGKHATMAKGAYIALQWYCIQDHIEISWTDNPYADDVDMILFYTEKPDMDIWEFLYSSPFRHLPKFFLIGNYYDICESAMDKTMLENRLGQEQIGTIHYNTLLAEAFYKGKINSFLKAAKEGNCYATARFQSDVGHVIFAVQKYKEVYYG